MSTRPKNSLVPAVGAGAEPPSDASPASVGNPRALYETLRACVPTLTAQEKRFAELFCVYRNKVKAYREAYDLSQSRNMGTDWAAASRISNKPQVLAYVRELEAAAAAATVLDVAALLEHDRQIVEGSMHANELTRFVWLSCRYCHGKDHHYQWIDQAEYALAIAAAMDAEKPLPPDDGGYGFNPNLEPDITCPQCEGRGVQQMIVADTRTLSGPVAAWFRGVKQTRNGLEVLTHDVDKAKERLLRASGMFGDDAASVARGAAAGAAAGVATATVLAAERAEAMTTEQAQRIYLELAG